MIAVTFSVLAICCLVHELFDAVYSRVFVLIPAAVIILFLFSFPEGARDIRYLHELQIERETIIEEAVSNQKTVALIPRFVTKTDYPACPEEELSEDSSFWYNNLVAEYYGIEEVRSVPEI